MESDVSTEPESTEHSIAAALLGNKKQRSEDNASIPAVEPDDQDENGDIELLDESNKEHDRKLAITGTSTLTSAAVKLKKELTVFNAVTMVVGQIIGSGIFITPAIVLQYSGSFGLALICWTVGGVIAIGGGLSFAELGTLLNTSGGEYSIIREGYSFRKKHPAERLFGDLLGYLAIWTIAVLEKPGSIAIVSLTAGKYLSRAIADEPPGVAAKLLAVGIILLLAMFNCYSLKATAMIINILSIAKVLALLFISALGIWQLIVGDHNDNFRNAFDGTTRSPGDVALALYSVMWSYYGWSSLSYTVEESRNAAKNLPRGIIMGVPIVMFCYIFVNIAFFAGLSKLDILSSQVTGLQFGEVLLGNTGLVIVSLLVSISTFGSSMGNMYGAPRVAMVAAREGAMPEVLSCIHDRFKTPVPAIIFLAAGGIVLVAIGDVSTLINGLAVPVLVIYGLVFAAAIIMRVTKRKEERPYKVWIIVHILMMLVSVVLVILPLVLSPDERVVIVIGFSAMLLGIPVFFVFVWDRLRIKVFSKLSEKLTRVTSILLETSSTRPNGYSASNSSS